MKYIIFGLLIVGLSSCMTKEKCLDKYGETAIVKSTDTTVNEVYDTTVKRDTVVRYVINRIESFDSISLESVIEGDTLITENTRSKSMIFFNSSGEVINKLVSKPDTLLQRLHNVIRERDRYKELYIETKKERIETIKVNQIPDWVLILWGVSLIIFFIIGFKVRQKM